MTRDTGLARVGIQGSAALTLALALVIPSAGQTQHLDRGPTFSPPSQAALQGEIARQPTTYEVENRDKLTALSAAAACSSTVPGQIDVALAWDVQSGDSVYRVDVAKFADGFATGRFLNSAPQRRSQGALRYDNPEPGIYYYWRLLGRTSTGWVVHGNGRFEAPVCPVDWIEE